MLDEEKKNQNLAARAADEHRVALEKLALQLMNAGRSIADAPDLSDAQFEQLQDWFGKTPVLHIARRGEIHFAGVCGRNRERAHPDDRSLIELYLDYEASSPDAYFQAGPNSTQPRANCGRFKAI
jgi:hypothetical protein